MIPPPDAAGMTRAEKQEMLRRILVERISRTRTAPASFAQERLWLLDRMHGAGAAYHLPLAMRFTGEMDVRALERAVGELVRRHEPLRTVLAEQDGAPVQVISPFAGFTLPVEDLPGADAAAVRARAAEESARPFDLAAGPLFRARLLRIHPVEHVLLLCMHHVVGDGWSISVITSEISDLYDAFREGRPSPLPEPAFQYADYAVQQRERLRGAALDKQLAYWRTRLADAPALLELPADHPRPAAQSWGGRVQGIGIDRAVLEPLEALARREGATLHMVLLAAFQVLLGRHAGSEDVVVGSPVAGRGRKELEPLVGFFVNTVALRTDLAGDPPFREVVRRARAAALGAYAHQELPFERVVAEVRPERTPGHAPLVQVMFSLEAPLPGGEGIEVIPLEAETGTSKFDLTLALEGREDGLRGGMEYRTDLFEPETIRRLAERYVRLLESAGRNPDARLSALSMMDDEERRRVVTGWNRTATAYPARASLAELVEAQAARAPDAPAVIDGDASTSYAELNARANRLARHLAKAGVAAEARVGVCLARGTELIVALLAVVKAGGAYVPLDPELPAERLAFILADAGVGVVVTDDAHRRAIPAIERVTFFSVDGDAAAIAAESGANLGRRAEARSLAHVIYTSGSTGTPKGAGVEHRGVIRLVRETDFVRIGADDRVAQASTVAFDAATFEVWGALLNGAALVVIPRDVVLSPERLVDALRRNGVTITLLTTAVFNQVARERPDAFRGMRAVLFGGEAADAAAVRAVLAAGGPERLVNAYGPTENSVVSTACAVDRLPAAAATVPIGRPVANSTAYVLGTALEPLPAGVPGELYVGGHGVARGYLGRPALTAERFVPDPFSTEPGARLYRTGDRVRARSGGTLDYLGRLDGQVKIRGFRIEAGEIEAVLRRHPAVSDCVVLPREDARGETRLVGWIATAAASRDSVDPTGSIDSVHPVDSVDSVSPADSIASVDAADSIAGVDADGLRAYLRRSLPDWMVPAAFVLLDRLPLTVNGKVDRRALPEPEETSGAYVAPRTETEAVLAAIWAEVLRAERVGAGDDFFALGGHSLLATRVVSRVRAALGVELTVRALFEAPSLAAFAAAVDALRGGEAASSTPSAVPAADRERPLPLSFAQERLWLVDRLRPGGSVYNVPMGTRLRGALDVAALERSLGEIVRRHEALRTTFRQDEGAPVQVIHPFAGFLLPIEDLSALADEEREETVRRRAAEDAARPFDLAVGPLFRASLLRLGAEEHVLLLCLHHVVTDGWSMGVLHRELAALYAAFVEGRPSPLAELPMQYADFAAWQREEMRGDALASRLAYWRERMAGAPALLELPTDRPRPVEQSHRGAQLPMSLDAALAERLEALARAEGATLYMVLLAAFQLLLGRHAGSGDVVVGSPVAGRTRAEVEGLIGFFVNTVVMRTSLAGDPSFRALLGRVRETTLGAYEHQELPFETLVAELQPERSLGHAPLFQVLFALQTADGSGGALPGLRAAPVEAALETAMFDLTLLLAPAEDGTIAGALTYATDLFDRGTMERLIGHLRRVLEQVAEDADRPMSRIELLDDGERRHLLGPWSGVDAPHPADCLHRLFAAQVARTPDAVALVHEAESLTYAELDARANRTARHLRHLGVRAETRVGICLPRGMDLVPAILGVLKAGGAYVPLDPAWPADRLAFMQADSGMSVLLTVEAVRGILPHQPTVRIVPLDAAAEAIAREAAEAPADDANPRNLAYLIYTSGSTGVPKGVAIEHASAAALLGWAEALYTEEEIGGMLASTSICFDMSVFELFAALTRGGRVILVENALALADSARADEVRLIDTVPSAIAALLKTGGIPPGVRTVNLGGEPLAAELVDALYARGIDRVFDLYGPSEDTTFSTYALRRAGAPASIGRPVENSRGYVVDDGLRLVPQGVIGELCLGGAGLARGYLGRPALTAARFIPDPFGAEPGGRLYRTGDRVRWRADGTLEYRGRFDHQVKVRGFRVEPGEIEAALRGHPAVSACAVVARADGAGETRLAAYVVGAATADALRAHLRQTLPEYMVPAAFVRLDALPLTPSGKVDRLALPSPEAPASSSAERTSSTRTPVEEVLAGIWAGVLNVDAVDADDNFFHLGGHSLLATVAVARIQEVLGVRLPLSAFFQAPTLAELAARVDSQRRAGLPALPPVVAVDRDADLPLSWAQERLWFLDSLQPGLAFYNVPVALWLDGAVDARALETALGEVVRRHEVLRTTFHARDGAARLVVSPFTGFRLPVEAVGDEDEARRRAAAEAARPFDLSAGPLFRARLLRIAADRHVLLVSLHHAVSDEWSLGILFRELSAHYAAAVEGSSSILPDLPVQYADYAVWQRERLQGEALDRQLAYWRDRLAGAPALLELPTDHPRPALQTHRGAREPFAFPAALLGRLEALGRGEGATLFMVLLGALQVLLSKYTGSEDVLVGSPITGRMRHETEGLIGFFANTLVLRADLAGDPTFREVLRRAREAALGAYDHQDVPFERLVEEVQPERSLGHSPLFQVMLIQGAGDPQGFALPGVSLARFEGGTETSKFDLSLAVTPHAGGLEGSLEYSTDLFERPTVLRMIGHLERLLEQVAADPELRISAIDLLGEEERRLVLEAWNGLEDAHPPHGVDVDSIDRAASVDTVDTVDAAAAFDGVGSADLAAAVDAVHSIDGGACVHHLFEARAARTPNAIAVVHEGESLTYAQLDARADALARRLRALGVGPEARVGICLERGTTMVAAVLAVLKAGGAYVPLDPKYPPARLAFMAADSAMHVLLTQTSLRDAIAAPDAVRVLSLDAESWDADGEAADERQPRVEVGPENLAFVLYTSGSTGRPKGVAMPHGALVNLVAWHLAEGTGPLRTLQFSSLSFDVSFQEIATTLASGGTLVLVDDAVRRDPDALLRFMEHHAVERLFLPFVALQSLAEAAGPHRGGPHPGS